MTQLPINTILPSEYLVLRAFVSEKAVTFVEAVTFNIMLTSATGLITEALITRWYFESARQPVTAVTAND
jgi:hypothetical protein